jgi:hypothetical protein
MLISRNLVKLPFWIYPYFLMLIAGLMLPSDGNHGIMTPKSLTFLGTFGSLVFYTLFKNTLNRYQIKLLLFSLLSISFLIIWMFIGHVQKGDWNDGAFDQFKIFAITIATVIMTLNVVNENLATKESILRLVIYANFVYSILKMAVVLLHLLGLLDMWKVLDFIGIRYMTMAILSGNLSRLQTSVDIITPFLLFFVLQNKRLKLGFSNLFIIFFVLVSLPAIFLSFSRFLYGVAGMSILLYAFTVNISSFVRLAIVTITLSIVVVAWSGIENIEKLIYERFYSYDNKMSDQARVDQIVALMDTVEKMPLVGKGLGGYADSLFRDGVILHSYEVQWVAFLMQFGILGLSLLMVPVFIIGYKLFLPPFTRVKLAFFGLFGIWLLSGFTNPFLISLTSGIVYAIFILAADILNNVSHEEFTETQMVTS